MDNKEQINLSNVMGGLPEEIFQEEWGRLIENCMDVNTPEKPARELHIIFKLKPNKDRNSASLTIERKVKLADADGSDTVLAIGVENGEPVAYDTMPRQMGLFNDNEGEREVTLTPFRKVGE